MKRIVVACCLFFISNVSTAEFYFGTALEEGRIENEKCDLKITCNTYKADFYRGYIIGVYDANSGRELFCPPNGTLNNQVFAIVSNYVKSHPEKWNLSADILVTRALSETYPCAKREKKEISDRRVYM